MDIAAIGSAIADMFSSLTPPTGYTALQKVSSKRQMTLGKLPAVVVSWDGTRDVELPGFHQASGTIDYTATLYLPKIDDETDDTAQQAWHDVVIDVLLPKVQLDEWDAPNQVKGAYVRSVVPGEEQLGEPYYAALAIAIEVEFWRRDVSTISA